MVEEPIRPRPPSEAPPDMGPLPPNAEPFDARYEFESWTCLRLQRTVEAIHTFATTEEEVNGSTDDQWTEVASVAELEPGELRKAVTKELASACVQRIHTSDECATAVQGQMLLGTLLSADNRLALHFHKIRKILTLFSSSVDQTWKDDEIEYKEVILGPANHIGPHIDGCVDFVGKGHRYGGVNVLVCCGTGIRRSACVCTAYLMSLDHKGGDKYERALNAITTQRPSVHIGGGDLESVGGDGASLVEALKMYEWELNAKAAVGASSPRLLGLFDPPPEEDVAGKRKSPHLAAAGPEEPCDSPGTKKVKAATHQLSEFTL